MKLPFFSKSSSVSETYFGLFLKGREGMGMVMSLTGSKLNLQSQEKFAYSNGFDNLTEDIDQLILRLEKETNIRLEKTIFFIYSHFIDEKTGEIKSEYLEKIKILATKLDLKAIGYIECYEAVKYFLEKKEEIPLTAVLIELDHTSISVLVYKRGELIFSKTINQTNNIIDDLLTCFLQIKGKFLLPSRIILYNSKDLNNESTEIVTNRWSEELFVQLPRVEILQEHELIQGLLGVFGEQIGKRPKALKSEKKAQETVMGFKIGADVEESKVEETPQSTIAHFPNFSQILISLKDRLKTIPSYFNKKWMIILGITLILLGLALNEYFLHKATLTLLLPFKAVRQEIELTSDEFEFKKTSKVSNYTESKATSGKKEIGEEARGSVSIHNFDDNEKTFNKGTVLETGAIKFSLDADVKVASASVVMINGGLVKQPGKDKVNITAQEIGPSGNLSSGKQFSIADLPTNLYFAINDSAFAGGSKKEVKIVAKKDMDELVDKVQQLAKKQKQKKGKLSIIPQLTEVKLEETKFDKETGEEADKIQLQAKVAVILYSFDPEQLKSKIAGEISKTLEKGYSIEENELKYQIRNAEKEDDEISLTLSVDGKAIKDIKQDEVVKRVRGKNVNSLRKLLKNNFNVDGVHYDIEPKLPIFNNLMPFLEKNITLKISSL